MTAITDMDAQVLKAYADSGMKVQTAAHCIYCHPNTINYHLDRVKTKTGMDPRDFWSLVRLLQGHWPDDRKEAEE